MPTAAIVLLALSVAIVAAVAVVAVRRPAATPVLREVVVHTRKPDDQTLRGLVDPAVLGRRDPWLVLTAVRYADVNGDTGRTEWLTIEGDVTVPRDGVAFVQLP